jgi:hypothetical protein
MSDDAALLRLYRCLRLLGVALIVAGCRTARPTGTSSMELLTPISEPAPASERKLDFSTGVAAESTPPEAIGELRKPEYPPAALTARPGTYVANVTVTIDASGLVSEVEPTWNRLTPPNPYSEQLLAAVRAAAASWRFIPARHVYWRKNKDGEPVYDHADAVVCETDLRFVFAPTGPAR